MDQEVLKYLKNIVNKLIHLDKKIDTLHIRMNSLELTTMNLGKACGTAFSQTKDVIEHLGGLQEKAREELGEYSGVLIDHSQWF